MGGEDAMPAKTTQKERLTFTLSPNVVGWIVSKAREKKISRSELIDQVLDRYLQQERQKKMEEGYKALGTVLRNTAQASLPLQKKAVPDY